MSYETIKQGFLEKEGESTGGTVVSRWRRRFFVIEVAEGGAARISYRDEQAERLGVAGSEVHTESTEIRGVRRERVASLRTLQRGVRRMRRD